MLKGFSASSNEVLPQDQLLQDCVCLQNVGFLFCIYRPDWPWTHCI